MTLDLVLSIIAGLVLAGVVTWMIYDLAVPVRPMRRKRYRDLKDENEHLQEMNQLMQDVLGRRYTTRGVPVDALPPITPQTYGDDPFEDAGGLDAYDRLMHELRSQP